MKFMKYIAVLFALMCALTLSVCADDWFIGDWDDFEETTVETTSPDVTTEPETTTEPVTSEPETSTEEETTDPESSTSETTAPEESVSGEETSAPAQSESGTQGGEGTTERPDVQTTEPDENPSESGTQSEQGSGSPLPLPLILAVLGVFGVGCIALVVFVLIKYARAQKA